MNSPSGQKDNHSGGDKSGGGSQPGSASATIGKRIAFKTNTKVESS